MLRVGFVLRSTEIQPACFRFVSPGRHKPWGVSKRSARAQRQVRSVAFPCTYIRSRKVLYSLPQEFTLRATDSSTRPGVHPRGRRELAPAYGELAHFRRGCPAGIRLASRDGPKGSYLPPSGIQPEVYWSHNLGSTKLPAGLRRPACFRFLVAIDRGASQKGLPKLWLPAASEVRASII